MEPKIARIMMTTAFKELSYAAAPYAAMLARMHGAELHVLHVASVAPVVAAPGLAAPGTPVAPTAIGPAPEELLRDAREQLASFRQEHLAAFAGTVVTAVVLGDPVGEIVRYATDNRIDLVVMGTHGDGVLRRIIFGSVSKSVVEHSPCPVLLVPVHSAPRT